METTLTMLRNWRAQPRLTASNLLCVMRSVDADVAAHIVNATAELPPMPTTEPTSAPQPIRQAPNHIPPRKATRKTPRKPPPRIPAIFIDVTKEHIDQGDCKNPQQCAIAAAIREEIPHVSYVAVRTNGITIVSRERDGGDGYKRHFAVPTKAARAIVAFDAGEEVKPFAFKAKLIDQERLWTSTPEQRKAYREQQEKKRARLLEQGLPLPVYGKKLRVAGV
jgi:hypothetical protein